MADAMKEKEYKEYLDRIYDEKLDDWYGCNLLEETNGNTDEFEYDEEEEQYNGIDKYGFFVAFDKDGKYLGKIVGFESTGNPPREYIDNIIKGVADGQEQLENLLQFYAHYAPTMMIRVIGELGEEDERIAKMGSVVHE